jgi:hypothetical protein
MQTITSEDVDDNSRRCRPEQQKRTADENIIREQQTRTADEKSKRYRPGQ